MVIHELFKPHKNCPICGAETKHKLIEQKTQYKLILKHFCKKMNGNCTQILTYLKKKRNS